MARILISCYSPLTENDAPIFVCMYEGFFKALADAGNDVMVINSAFLIIKAWNSTNQLLHHIDAKKLVAAVRDFDPELTFAFNHSIPDPVIDALDCPIVLWDSDSIQFFNDKERIKKTFSRYHFFCFAKSGMENILAFGAPRDRVYFMPSATAIKAEPVRQDKNISFIGTMFQNHIEVKSFLQNYPDRAERDALIKLVKQGYDHLHDDFIVQRKELIETYLEISVLFSMYSPQRRIETLNVLSDLGLTLYGMNDWYDASKFFPDISAAYVPQRVYSLQHNQDIYNSSQLCLNISHAQVVDGYAWRVLDVMASNGCLFSDYSPGIASLLKDYIDLPMYRTPGEARDLAKKLLADEPYRRAIVEASQACIEERGRWHHRFAEMESILGLKLLHDKKGSLRFLDPRIYYPDRVPSAVSTVAKPISRYANAVKRRAKRAIVLAMPTGITWAIEKHRMAKKP